MRSPEKFPLGGIPLGGIPLGGIPLGGIPLGGIPLGGISHLDSGPSAEVLVFVGT